MGKTALGHRTCLGQQSLGPQVMSGHGKLTVHVKFNVNLIATQINPLSPHDALKHHFTSLKTDLIFLHSRVLERKFSRNWFTNTW